MPVQELLIWLSMESKGSEYPFSSGLLVGSFAENHADADSVSDHDQERAYQVKASLDRRMSHAG